MIDLNEYKEYLESLINEHIDGQSSIVEQWEKTLWKLVDKNIKIWNILTYKEIIQFDSIDTLWVFMNYHRIKDIFVYKESLKASNYIENVNLEAFNSILKMYEDKINEIISNKYKLITLYVHYEGSLYGIELREDDSNLYKLKTDFYCTLQGYNISMLIDSKHKIFNLKDRLEKKKNDEDGEEE